MPMRLSGLMSGMDTESIIQQLVEAKKTKVTTAVKAQKSLKYKQDAWKELNKKVVNLYNKSLTTMRFESSYVKKTTKVSNSSIVSVITGEGAMNSVQNLEVSQLAKTGFLTGGTLELKKDADGNDVTSGTVTGKTKLSQLGYTGGTGNMKVTINGETTKLDVDENSTVEQFVSALRQVGLSANFDEVNQRFYVASKTSGTKNDFSLTATDAKGFEALGVLKLSYGYGDAAEMKKYQDIIDGYGNGTGKTVTDRQAAQLKSLTNEWNRLKNNRVSILQGLSEESLKAVNEKLTDKNAGFTFELDESGDEPKLVKKNDDGTTTELADIEYADWKKIDGAIEEVYQEAKTNAENASTDEEKEAASKLMSALDVWEKNQGSLEALEVSFVGKSDLSGEVEVDENGMPQLTQAVKDTIKAAVEQEAKDAQAVLDELDIDKKIADKLQAIENDATMTDAEKTAAKKAAREEAIAAMGQGQKTAAQDSIIYLNDVMYKSDRNTFEVNGLTMTVSGTTAPGESVTITTEDDTDGIYDMIKNFFKEYNSLINEMDKLYNADSAKGYDPLTDEEKAAMSDSQIEEWENKIKDSILRKDSTLSTFSQAMKTIMMEGVEVNGKTMYLSNFGIGTLNYFTAADNERNAYHIDGDPDDENTANNADRLKSMIASDPDTVVSFFTQLSQKLSDKMFDLMKAKEGYSSAMTVYDDKKMQTEYDDYTTKIKELEDKLADYEDKWYAKFAAMETALAKMQNNASAVTALLGG